MTTNPAPLHFLPVKLVSFETLPSTNDYLKGLSLAGHVEEGTVILALNQTHGRGQLGKEWISEPGKNITLSLFLKPHHLSAPEAFLLSKCIAIAVQETIALYVTSEVSIKWPNDILVDGKKIAGILIENTIQGEWVKSSVVGIGVNINQESFSGPGKATSLKLESGDTFDVIDIVRSLIAKVKDQYLKLQLKDHAILDADYFHRLHRPGPSQTFSIHGVDKDCTIKDVKPDGSIVLQYENEEKTFLHGDARWVLNEP